MSSEDKPVMANHDYPFFDGAELTTQVGQKVYNVGQNQVNAGAGQKKLFVSKDTYIYCTTDTYVCFNYSENDEVLFYANRAYTILANVWAVFYRYSSESGTLELKFDGVLSRDARSSIE